jgi:broad specificity phosphatase PhoE
MDTARIIAERCEQPVYGAWEGLTWRAAAERDPEATKMFRPYPSSVIRLAVTTAGFELPNPPDLLESR